MLVDLIEEIDRILVMSVNPGFGGQSFIERALVKLAEVRALIDARNPQCEIEVDGGIGLENIERAVQAGADVLVAGTSVFGARRPAAALRDMRRRIDAVASASIAAHVTEDELDRARARERADCARRRRAPDAAAASGSATMRRSGSRRASIRSVITTDALVEGVHFSAR